MITSRFDGMSVKVAFSTSCCCTSLQNVNANLSLSLNVTAQSDILWHGTQCEALVGMAVNVHHVRRWSTRVKWSHTTVVNQALVLHTYWLAMITGHGAARRRRDRQTPPLCAVEVATHNTLR